MKERLPNRIRELRKSRGLSQEEVAHRVGELIGQDVSITAINRLESGRMELTQRWMQRIATVLRVRESELIEKPEIRMVPVLGSVPAGPLAKAIEDPQGWVPMLGQEGGPHIYALRPEGDSMRNLIGDHQYIIVDPDDLALESGRSYIVMNGDGEATFKRYRADPPRLEPASDNPAHKEILIGREPFIVAARVIRAVSKF